MIYKTFFLQTASYFYFSEIVLLFLEIIGLKIKYTEENCFECNV